MESGFFVMLNLSFREWDSVETYVEMIVTTDNEFLSKVFYRRIGYILYESKPSWAMSNFIKRFQISWENIYPFTSYDVLNFRSILGKLRYKFKAS